METVIWEFFLGTSRDLETQICKEPSGTFCAQLKIRRDLLLFTDGMGTLAESYIRTLSHSLFLSLTYTHTHTHTHPPRSFDFFL